MRIATTRECAFESYIAGFQAYPVATPYRICVPRDMSAQAATELTGYLDY